MPRVKIKYKLNHNRKLTAGFLSSGKIIWFFGFRESLFQMPPNQPLFEVELKIKKKDRWLRRFLGKVHLVANLFTFGPSFWLVKPIYRTCQSHQKRRPTWSHHRQTVRRPRRN